jgi:hypothetical protein
MSAETKSLGSLASEEIMAAYTAMRRASLAAEAVRLSIDEEIEDLRGVAFPGSSRMAVIGTLAMKKETLMEGLQSDYQLQLKPLIERLQEGPLLVTVEDITKNALKAKLAAREADPTIEITSKDFMVNHTPFMRHDNDVYAGPPPPTLSGEVRRFGTYSFVLATEQGDFSVTPVSVKSAIPTVEIQDFSLASVSQQEAA